MRNSNTWLATVLAMALLTPALASAQKVAAPPRGQDPVLAEKVKDILKKFAAEQQDRDRAPRAETTERTRSAVLELLRSNGWLEHRADENQPIRVFQTRF